ncbi:hypothetical protein [Streptomyces erythrochromogenes]|uniref:hypothetical protein n=1 Tax=Streptomyces erythrochromogenes TaxID=285574 RepID=UPI0036AE8000
MFAARALAALVLTAATVTPVACAPSAHVPTPPSASDRAAAGASGGDRASGHPGTQVRPTPDRAEGRMPTAVQ